MPYVLAALIVLMLAGQGEAGNNQETGQKMLPRQISVTPASGWRIWRSKVPLFFEGCSSSAIKAPIRFSNPGISVTALQRRHFS
jgi:hypothetical protein